MNIKIEVLLIIFFRFFTIVAFAQDENPTVYPYDGVQDSSRYEYFMVKIPLNFTKTNFRNAKFNSRAYFRGARFYSLTDFMNAIFNSSAFFSKSEFHKKHMLYKKRLENNQRMNYYKMQLKKK